MKMKRSESKKFKMFIGVTALTVSGFILIPPLMKKYTNMMYKKSLKNDEIDFNSMEPEIIPYDEKGEKNEY